MNIIYVHQFLEGIASAENDVIPGVSFFPLFISVGVWAYYLSVQREDGNPLRKERPQA